MKSRAVLFILLLTVPFQAQQPAPHPATAAASNPEPVIRARVYVTESDSWQVVGNSGGAGGMGGGHTAGGARPQTAEVIKTMGQRCPDLIVNNRPDASDYVIRLEHEGGKGLLSHKDKVAVFVRKTGDSIFSTSTLSLGGSVQGACGAISKDWSAHGAELAAMPAPTAPGSQPVVVVTQAAPAAATPTTASLTVEATVPNADIEVDGNFMGSTPSTLAIPPGQHTVTVKKKGYEAWTRQMNVAGNSVHLNADLTAKGN